MCSYHALTIIEIIVTGILNVSLISNFGLIDTGILHKAGHFFSLLYRFKTDLSLLVSKFGIHVVKLIGRGHWVLAGFVDVSRLGFFNGIVTC